MADYSGKRVAVLVTSGVEEVELTRPVGFLCALGATVTVITPSPDEYATVIRSQAGGFPGTNLYADALLSEVKPDDFDALYIPGGTSPDHLRLYPEAVEFVKAFRDKPIFALCHGPQMLVSAELVSGRTLTSWPSLEVDMKNAGATWVDRDLVVDGNLVTSRKPTDIPNFNVQIAKVLEHPEQFRRKAA